MEKKYNQIIILTALRCRCWRHSNEFLNDIKLEENNSNLKAKTIIEVINLKNIII